MRNFTGRLAVITGAGSGIGRELAVALASEGCRLALLDVNPAAAEETARLCQPNSAVTVSVHGCDVTDPRAVDDAADAVRAAHGTDHINLLVNNAGIGSVEGFVHGDREAWELTFDVCWGGVYNCCRSFVPLAIAAAEGQIVNVSSVNGLWASLGPNRTHTSYSAAKFAVRGFTEALITEMRLVAPHVKVAVVMPGHVGTNILSNSQSRLGRRATANLAETEAAFRASAPTTPAEAARIILEGVRSGRWRILVGHDAGLLDEALRADPEGAYESDFVARLHDQGAFVGLIDPI